MGDLRGPNEARLLAVERGLEAMDTRLRNLRRRAIAAGQSLWDAWGDVAAISPTPSTPADNTTVTGAPVTGCTNAIAGLSVVATNHATSAVLGMATTDSSGNFSVGFYLSSGTLSVDVTISGANWQTTVVNVTATSGSSVATGAIQLTPTTITLTDSVYGNCTLTYDVPSGNWIGCTAVSYPGTTFCAAGSIAIQYTVEPSVFVNNWQCLVNWAGHVVSGHSCPLPGSTCSSTLGFSRQVAATLTCSGTVWTFPAASNSPWPGTGAATCTVVWP